VSIPLRPLPQGHAPPSRLTSFPHPQNHAPASWLTSFERKVCETKNREYIFVLPVSEKIATLRKKKIFLYPHFFLWEEQGCNVHVQYMYTYGSP
jgi:hypothetical protein